MTTVLKLGGSVITQKRKPETVDRSSLSALADAVAGYDEKLVLIHGGGSFGHHHASKRSVTTEVGTRDAKAAREIHGAMTSLNDTVIRELAKRNVAALPVHPLSSAVRDESGDLTLHAEPVVTMLDEGFVPILHGDIVTHADRGVTVVSGDELVVHLATELSADRVGLCSAVPGVLDNDGRVIPRIVSFDDVADVLGGSQTTDVTGGMAAKVRRLLALDVPAYVFGVDGTTPFLDGGEPGTRIG